MKEGKKTKIPTQKKRMVQNKNRRLQNQMVKTKLRTALQGCAKNLVAHDKESLKETLSRVYSMVDKGVKKGVVPCNKANRIKAKLARKVAALPV